MREALIETLFKKALPKPWLCLKMADIIVGFPDRMVLTDDNRVFFVELKATKGGRLSEIQKFRIDELRKRGFGVYVIKSLGDIENFVKEVVTC